MKRVRIETVLREVLDQIDADFYIEADHVRVTTAIGEGPGHRARTGRCRTCRPDAAEELAGGSEVEVIAHHAVTVTAAFKDVAAGRGTARRVSPADRAGDRRVGPDGEKAKAPVTVALSNVPFETAVAVLAEAAGLRAFRTGNVAVIVTPERARQVEAPSAERRPGPGEPAGDAGAVGPARQDLTRADERKALEEKVRKLTEELEKLKKK